MYKIIVNFLFLIVAFFLTRQFPFGNLSIIMNLSCLAIFVLSIGKAYKDKLFSIGILYFTVYLLYTIFFTNNDPLLAVRFYIIICLLICSNFVSVGRITLIYGFSTLMLLQVTIVICLWLYLTVYFPSGNGSEEIRLYFVRNGFGDLYTHDTFYKVQLKGNALIPFFYMFLYHIFSCNKRNKIRLILVVVFLSIIFSGNFMFLVSIFLFHTYHIISFLKKNNKTVFGYVLKIISGLSIISFIPMGINIFFNVVEEKSALGSTSSMGIRYDQANVLVNNMSENIFSTFFGRGLGHTLSVVTASRNYTGDIYYELQSLYFLNQLGFINFFILIAVLFFIFMNKVKSNDIRIIYLCYVVYALSNPYILDTNHVIVILCLVSLQQYKSMKGNYKSKIPHLSKEL